jgi:hypothetical protein
MVRSSPVANNWLTVLFNINFRPSSTQASALGVLSLLDICLMFLFGVVMAAMYPVLSFRSKTWAAIAIALPFAGIPIFFATGTAGRSALLLAGLISSVLALRTQFGGHLLAWAGILASAGLLFLGDFGTAAFPPSTLLAALIAIGYITWTLWLFLVAVEFVRRTRRSAA